MARARNLAVKATALFKRLHLDKSEESGTEEDERLCSDFQDSSEDEVDHEVELRRNEKQSSLRDSESGVDPELVPMRNDEA